MLDRALSPIENGMNLCSGLLILALMFLGVAQIVLRTAFSAPIFGYIDIVEVSMVGFTILSIAYVQRLGGHIRMELLIAKLRGRNLWLAEFSVSILSLFIVGTLIPYSFDHFQRSFDFGDSTIDIELVTWPAKLVVPVALSFLFIRLSIQSVSYWRLFLHPTYEPIAIPLIKDTTQRVEEEILLLQETELNEVSADSKTNDGLN